MFSLIKSCKNKSTAILYFFFFAYIYSILYIFKFCVGDRLQSCNIHNFKDNVNGQKVEKPRRNVRNILIKNLSLGKYRKY